MFVDPDLIDLFVEGANPAIADEQKTTLGDWDHLKTALGDWDHPTSKPPINYPAVERVNLGYCKRGPP